MPNPRLENGPRDARGLIRRIVLRACLLLCIPLAVAATQAQHRAKVLVLYGIRPGTSNQVLAAGTLRERLVEPLGDRVSIYEEFPEFAWAANLSRPGIGGLAAAESYRRYLSSKYSSTAFDLVMAVGAPAFDFYRMSNPPLFPGVPLIACLVAPDRIQEIPQDSTVSIVTDSIELRGTLALALSMQPTTKRVMVISGASPGDLAYVRRTEAIRDSFPSDIQFDFLVGRSLSETERAVAGVDAKSIVLLLSFAADSAGNQYDQMVVARRLSAVTNAPIYSWTGAIFGSGIVGGQMLMTDSGVARAASLALRTLRGESFARLPRRVVDPTVGLLDERAVRRWQLDERRAPARTMVAYRDRTIWTRYRGPISLALALIVVQMGVIAALVVQRARRRRAEERGDALLAELRDSHDRIHQLAGHLITAQEAERTRIARELHDDVNQKIAALAIGLSRIRRHVSDDVEVAGDLSRLQERTTTLAEEVRHISHRLHSSVLQHAGVVAALESACREISTGYGIETSVVTRGDLEDVGDEVGLCLYRVVQEALRNAARHGGAGTIQVSIARDEGSIILSVADDGCGFDPRAARPNGGLGLVSLEERARLVGGALDVESKPGHGTAVRLSVPLRASVLGPVLPPEDHASRQGAAS